MLENDMSINASLTQDHLLLQKIYIVVVVFAGIIIYMQYGLNSNGLNISDINLFNSLFF